MNKYLKVIIIVLSIVGLFIWTFIGFPYLMWRDSGSYYEYFGSSSNIQLVSNNSEINDSENNFDLIVNYLINDDFNITENSINDFEFKYFVEKDITYGGEVTISNYTISIESYYHRHNYLVEKLDDHNNLPFE